MDKSPVQRLKDVITHQTSITAAHLYGIHFLNYLVPALTVALLTRRFTPPCYGRLIIAQSFGLTVSAITEYGFRWTGARAVAEDTLGEKLGVLVSSISGAKLLIAAACSLLILIYVLCIQSMRGHLWLMVGGYTWGVIQGSDLQWYFLGRERLRGYLTADTLSRALAVVLILIVIQDDRDVSKVLLIQAVCTLGLLIWALRQITAEVSLVWPTKTSIEAVMRDGGTLFLQQLTRYASGGVNIAILGMVTSPAEVGFFACADKLVRYVSSLAAPITQLAYPKISKSAAQHAGRNAANRLAGLAGAASLLMAAIVSVVMFLLPRPIILALYGSKMLPALSALRVVAIFPVLNSMTTSLVFYWLLPRRMENVSLRVMLFAGVVNIVSIAVLGKFWSQTGAASAVILTEVTSLAAYLFILRFSGADSYRPAQVAVLAKEAS